MLGAPVEAHERICHTHGLQGAIDALEQKYREKPAGIGTTESGSVLFLTMTEGRDGWTIVLSSPDGQACILATGHKWEAVEPIFGEAS